MLQDKAIQSRVNAINRRIAQIYKTDNRNVNSIFKNISLNSGKKLRGLLVLLTAEANGVKLNDSILNTAASVELLHHATLIHDDIVDDADKRRGRTSLNKKLGETLSVLTGDFLFSSAMNAMLRRPDIKLYSMFSGAVREVCEGEIDEVSNKFNAHITPHQCLEIIRKKTASLIRGSVKAGAYYGKYSPAGQKHLEIYGECLGMAFQIKDDLLDINSKTSKIGKSAGTDIREGKATLPLLLAMECAPEKESSRIRSLFEKNTNGKNTEKIIDFIRKYDGTELAWLMALSFSADAKAALNKVLFKNMAVKEILVFLADYVIEREF
jgi:geranylgeranyl pyrophosphate synthase